MSIAALALSMMVLAATAAPPHPDPGSACLSDRPGEQVGTSGSDLVIQTNVGRLRLCMVAEDAGAPAGGERPSQWPGRARRVVLESRRGNDVKRLEIAADGAGQRISWQVDRVDRTFDAAARQWRDQMLAALDTTWEIARLRAEGSGLSDDISSIRGEESGLRREISSLSADVGAMRARQASIRHDESKLRQELDAVRARPASLREAILVARNNISALHMGGSRPDAFQAPIERYENEIARLERELKESEGHGKEGAIWGRIGALDADRKVAAIEAEITRFDLDRKVAVLDKRIAALDVEGRVGVLQKKIDTLDADRRTRQLEVRRDSELKRLATAIAAIR